MSLYELKYPFICPFLEKFCGPFWRTKASSMIVYFQSGAEKPIALMLGMGAFMSFFTFATPLMVHYMSKKYVTEMYYNRITDTYTAITYSLFLRKKQVSFGSSITNFC